MLCRLIGLTYLRLIFFLMMISSCVHSSTAQNCPRGRFGPSCNIICHCLNGHDVCEEVGCKDLKCDIGWTAAPGCQDRCRDNKYGLNCFFHCHCPVNDKCDNRNGNCPSERCHQEWYGPGCQQRLARLFHPPTIDVHGCQNVTVSWNAWTYNIDVGVTNISAYILKMRRQENTYWQDVATTSGSSHNFIVNVRNVEKNGIYQFRVDILSKSEKENITGPPGVPTAFVHVPCVESNLIQPPSIEPHGEITFQMASNASGEVSYTETGIGNCLSIVGPTTKQSFQDVKNITLKTLPWTRYLVSIEIISPYNIKYVQSILSAETVPSGQVTNVRIDKITPTSVSLSWKGLNCSERGGVFVRFDVILKQTDDWSTGHTREMDTTNEMIAIEKLEPFTNYSVQVAFVNLVGRGNMSDRVEFQTKDSVPDAPKIVKIETSPYSLNMIWQPNTNTHSRPQEYQVICSENENFKQSISITNSAMKSNNVTFFNLKPFTDYYIKIHARANSGWGPFSNYVKIKTKEGPPLAPKQIARIHGNMTCLTLKWSPPQKINGILQSYEVTQTEMFSYMKIKQERKKATIKTGIVPECEICNLTPATQYEFTIRATTGGDQGDSSKPVSFWTEIMTPVAPPQPTIGKIYHTSFEIVLQPVLTYTGPVSWYEIRVEELQSVNGAILQKRTKREETFSESPIILKTSDLVSVLSPNLIGYSTVFTVGDNKTYGNVRNKPLSNRNTYRIYYVVYSSLNNVSKWNASSTGSPVNLLSDKNQGTISVIAIVIISVAIVLLVLLLLLLLIVFLGRKHWNRKHLYTSYIDKTLQSTDDEVLEKYWNTTYTTHERRFIVVNMDFIPAKPSSPVHLKQQKQPLSILPKQRAPLKTQANSDCHSERNLNPITFKKEFDTLNELPKPKYTFNEAMKMENTKLNRFIHLLPFDHSRVRLESDSTSSSTYINASFITKPAHNPSTSTAAKRLASRVHIAAQSPFNPETMRDFWRLIYQHQVRVVVMLTKNVEDKIIKCSEYFPKIIGQSFTFEQFVMRVVNIDSHVDFSITEILLELIGGRQMNLYVFKLFRWPEKRTVGYSLPLLDMQRKVRQFSDRFPANPVLVHCGTGNGRSGVFIAIDFLLDEYKQQGSISVFSHIKHMRECRPYMVRTFTQYLLIYDAILEACQAGDLSFFRLSDLHSKCQQLDIINWKTSRSFLEDQFALLCFLTPKPNIDQIRTGLLPENSGKHRYPDVIPPDEFRPPLPNSLRKNTTKPTSSMYINAVFIDTYKRKGGYIVTQTPLSNSLEDFWSLVYEYGVKTIVMMDINIKGDTCISYWKHEYSFEYLTVTPRGKCINNRATVHRLMLRRNDSTVKETARVVRLFRFKCWKNPHFVPVGRDSILDLIVEINKWQEKTSHQPIVVHCKDGATNSGLFCTVDLLIQEMTHEKCIDVYRTVKKMKIRRPQIIPNVEQYKFCHSVIQLHASRHKL